MDALEAVGLNFVYPGGVKALVDVTFSIAPGEFAAILGANGSGKTTLFRLFSGMLHPTSGEIKVAGLAVGRENMNQIYRILGFVFQDPNDQLFAPTVRDDVSFGPRNMGLDLEEVAKRTEIALAQVRMQGFEERPVHALSFGQKRRVAIAGVLAMRPKIVILDEPTSGLDPAGVTHVMDLLHHLNHDDGITIAMSSHDVDMMAIFADKGYVLHEGRLLAAGKLLDIFADGELIEMAGLRLPYVAQLISLVRSDLGLDHSETPLTVQAARGWLHEHVRIRDVFGERKGPDGADGD